MSKTYNTKELIKELWSAWESLAETGEIHIGPNFIEKYSDLKEQVEHILMGLDE